MIIIGFNFAEDGDIKKQMANMANANVPPFRFVELFAGIGGFRVALEALGGQCTFACEIEPQVLLTVCDDVRELY